MAVRRFPPPWSIEDLGAALLLSSISDLLSERLYFAAPRVRADWHGRRQSPRHEKLFTRDEVRLIAANIGKLPGPAEGLVASMRSSDWTGRRNVLCVSVAEAAHAPQRLEALFKGRKPAIRTAAPRLASAVLRTPGIILRFGGCAGRGSDANC